MAAEKCDVTPNNLLSKYSSNLFTFYTLTQNNSYLYSFIFPELYINVIVYIYMHYIFSIKVLRFYSITFSQQKWKLLWVWEAFCIMAGDPQRRKRKVMTGVMFSTSNCHSQRPHCFIRHFGSYHAGTKLLQNLNACDAKSHRKVKNINSQFVIHFNLFSRWNKHV